MADFDSSLPIRTGNDGDIVSKIADADTPSQQLAVGADGSINITDNGGSLTVDATNLDIRDLTHVSDSVKIGDGVETVAVNASNEMQTRDDDANTLLGTIDSDTSAIAAGQLADGHNVTVDNASGASAVNIQDGGNSITVDAIDLDIRDLNAATDKVAIQDTAGDELGINADGSINVVLTGGTAGDDICEYNTSASVASDASVNHDYTVTLLKTLGIEQIMISASSRIKAEILIGGFTVFVAFNSSSNPNINIPSHRVCKAAAGEVVRITITNRDNQAQDVYSTLIGLET